jgi:hypothetical protein
VGKGLSARVFDRLRLTGPHASKTNTSLRDTKQSPYYTEQAEKLSLQIRPAIVEIASCLAMTQFFSSIDDSISIIISKINNVQK